MCSKGLNSKRLPISKCDHRLVWILGGNKVYVTGRFGYVPRCKIAPSFRSDHRSQRRDFSPHLRREDTVDSLRSFKRPINMFVEKGTPVGDVGERAVNIA